TPVARTGRARIHHEAVRGGNMVARHQGSVGRRRCAIGAFALLFLSGTVLPLPAEEYQLGPQDRIRVKIYEWRASRDEIFEWTALNDTFVVSPGGKLSLPFAGEIDAAGLTPSDVAERVGDRLMEKMGLGRRP